MKKLKRIFCMLFLCMMITTLNIYADSIDGSGGITFDGDEDIELTPTGTPSTTDTPQDTGKRSGTGTTSGNRSSLPQTGQEADMVLPSAGGVMLILAGWLVVVRSRKNRYMTGTVTRKENMLYW